MRKTLASLAIASSVALSSHISADPRVDGLANYLSGITQKNFSYVVEQQLLKNELLQCYFPTVYNAVLTVGFVNAINFNPKTWAEYFDRDLQRFFSVALLQTLDGEELDAYIDIARDGYIENFLQVVQVHLPDANEKVSLDVSPTKLEGGRVVKKFSDKDTKIHNSYSVPISEYFIGLSEIADLAKATSGLDCNRESDIPSISALMYKFDSIRENFDNAVGNLGERPLFVEGHEVNAQNIATLLTVYGLMEVTGISQSELQELGRVVDSENLETQLLYVFSLIEKASPSNRSSRSYVRFKEFVLLSAKLAGAENANTVETALKNYFVDDVSYGIKRQYTLNVTTQAYFNMSYDSTIGEVVPNLPLGLEVSLNAAGMPLGVMISGLDFAGPTISALEEDKSKDFDWGELISPAIQGSLGFKDIPLAITGSYHFKSKAYRIGLGLDMPLMNLSR